jgi:hypothetical protein
LVTIAVGGADATVTAGTTATLATGDVFARTLTRQPIPAASTSISALPMT